MPKQQVSFTTQGFPETVMPQSFQIVSGNRPSFPKQQVSFTTQGFPETVMPQSFRKIVGLK